MIIQGTAITGTTVSSSAATVDVDSYFNLVSLLLPGTGTNGAQNNTFLDSSTNAFTITRNGNTTQGTFSPFSQTGWSNYFDGVASTPMYFADNDAFTFNADFTVEAWVYLNNTSAFQVVVGKWDVGTQEWLIGVDANGVAEFHWAPYSVGGPAIESSSGAVLANQWTHIAAVRSGSTITLYVNGISVGTRTNGTAGTNYTSLVTVGYLQYLGGDKLAGYVSNLRIVKGTAVYTGAFTPSSVPLTAVSGTSLLTCQTNRFVDNSTNNFTPVVNSVVVNAFAPFDPATAYAAGTVGGSAYFDGSGDYLSVPDNTAWNFGSGDFTVEAWYYPTVASAQQIIIGQWDGAGGGTGLNFVLLTSNNTSMFLRAAASSDGANVLFDLISTSALRLNAWNHVALVRSGTTFQLYLNGVAASNGSTTSSASLFNATNVLTVGASSAGGQLSTGYISSVRIVKGTAVYTGSTYTVPTAPVTAIANTQLLLNYTNAGITDATAKGVFETVGSAQISTAQSKWGGSAMLFDGTGDYLQMTSPSRLLINWWTQDFTIEGWIYPTTLTNTSYAQGGNQTPTLIGNMSPSTDGNYWSFGPITNGTLRLYYYNGSSIFAATSTETVTINQWNHIALTNVAGVGFKYWVNGIGSSNITVSGTPLAGSELPLMIGWKYYSAGSAGFTGYIDDVRITTGLARYTTNFTPPTAAFPTQ